MCEVSDVTKIVKKPDVESGISPETKPLKKGKKIILKKKLFCVDVLSLDADIFYSLKCCKWRSHFSMCLHKCSLHAA